jgi:rare lipoprotein A
MALLAGCGCISGPAIPRRGRPQMGTASWYGREYHGRKTSNGEIFDMYELTAAHRKLPFGTFVRVTNLKNRKSVVVKINDRGPWKRGRIIDLSYAAAKKIGMVKDGITRVKVEIVKR